MTVRGPVDPSELGFTLPHEHTQIHLWQIEGRWDYWELTRDEPLILEELGAYRAAGGTALVDLTGARRRTRSTLARRAGGAERAPPRDRRGLVSRCLLPAGAAGRSAVGRFAGRGARRRGDQRDRGHGRPAGDPGRDRHGQAVGDAGRGAGPPRRRPREPPDGPRDHDARRPVRRGGRAADDLRGGGGRSGPRRDRARGQLPAPRSLPVADQPGRLDRVRLPGHVVHAHRGPRRGPDHRPPARAAPSRPRATGSCSARTCATTASSGATAATATRTSRRRSCPASASAACPTPRSTSSRSRTRAAS